MTLRELMDRVPEEKWGYHLEIETLDRNLFTDMEIIGWVGKIDDARMRVTLEY
jgi:hypothetical protein